MAISDLRTALKTRSGDSNLTNAECDSFINTGIRLLDRMTETTHGPARAFQKLTILGTHTVQLTSACRAVSSVWIIDKTAGRIELIKADYQWLRGEYSELSSLTKGQPIYYALGVNRDTDGFNPADIAYADYAAYIDTIDADTNQRALEIMPPIDKEYLIEIHGKFYSTALSDTVTNNWWSANASEAVLLSALYYYESHLRNTEGAKDYFNTLSIELTELTKDYAEETAAATIMEG